MRRCLLLGLLAATTPGLALGDPGAPLQWSPDGRWLAYTVAGPPRDTTAEPDWFYDEPEGAVRGAEGPQSYRIYAADPESGASVRVAESSGPLTPPSWSPDGRALAFGRVVDDRAPVRRFELVVVDATERVRVVAVQELSGRPGVVPGPEGPAPVWSPDGRYLAAPDVKTARGFRVVRVADGRVIRSVEGGAPAWSPDGTKIAFVRDERLSSLQCVDLTWTPDDPGPFSERAGLSVGPPRHLVDLGQTFQGPVWSRDGKSVTALARRLVVRPRGPSVQVDLLRVRVDSGSIETVANLTAEPIELGKAFRGAVLAQDRDAGEIFYALDLAAEPAAIVWYRPANQETVDRFQPVNLTRVQSLSCSPDAGRLAIRFGDSAQSPAVGLYDLKAKKLRLLAPDEGCRLAWVSLLVSTADRLLKTSFPPESLDGRALRRPTVLPEPGELAKKKAVLLQLQQLGRLGRQACEPSGLGRTQGLPPGADRPEARLFFQALIEDYPAALKTLDALEAATTGADRLARLLAVRAQLYLGMEDAERAADTIGFLKTLSEAGVWRYEQTPTGVALRPEVVPGRDWARYLSARLDELRVADAGKKVRADIPDRPEHLPDPGLPPFQLEGRNGAPPNPPVAPEVVVEPPNPRRGGR